MKDPFSELRKSLQSVFQLEAMRNDKYTYPPVQQLKEATLRYSPDSNGSFIALLKAIREALPFIEKWRVNFDDLRTSMDTLAKMHHLPPIDWRRFLSHPKVSPHFQFSALNHARQEEDLIAWLEALTRTTFTAKDHAHITQAMVDNRERHGFSQRLKDYLKIHPNFLFVLCTKSENNFIKIAHTRLVLYLTDEQLAHIILQHIPALVQQERGPFERVTRLVNTLNHILSNGRSVTTLCRNAKAEAILKHSLFFQIYLSEEYKHKDEKKPPRQSLEDSALKPHM
ncbi:hypothetical protein [Legionella shakespearei]|uniref:Uncharacterized protein n=1 Tax=Legionella shakespearei DSM 23087 TaxID=1122169 RepID=A0A0W0YKD9_9GAMM|nr:hypothetical protein [Legionella shakespearei]KTD57303.1 hypothetical protein Lsha_2685 [Legionella shakespearei DSM 23087]